MKAYRSALAISSGNAATLAASIFAVHFFYSFFLQAQSAVLLYDVDLPSIATAQFQTLASSAVVSCLFLLVPPTRPARTSYFAVLTALFLIYATNNVYIGTSGSPFSLSATEGFSLGETGRYWGSFAAELGPLQYLNYGMAVAAGTLLAWLDVRASRSSASLPGRRWVYAALSPPLLLLAGFGLGGKADDRVEELTRNPVLALATELAAGTATGTAAAPGALMSPEQFYSLAYGTELEEPRIKATLAKDLELLRQRKRNIVFVILESVASRQLLEDGVPRSDIAPFLHAQAKNAIIFDNLTTVFPGSTRSQVAMMTGGATITWGSVYSELLHAYRGQTLVSAFREDGRPTALFSAGGLDFENLNIFYANLGFDAALNPDSLPADTVAKHRTHSWGVDERYVADLALKWAPGRTPFFMSFLNVITHHPYGAPADYKSPFEGNDNIDKYKTSIHFTDSVLASMTEALKSMGIARDTLLIVTGDHGEAFGEHHAGNLLHKNYLYEENIRNFLMIIDLSEEIDPVLVPVRGATADILPTVLDIQGIRADDGVLGQSLLSPSYRERIAFFHKNAEPEKWGLRDGQWKFIVDRIDSKNPELYDLGSDPFEQTNVAARFPERIDDYVNRLSNWYLHTNDAFVSRLDHYDYESSKGFTVANLSTPGPKRIAIGAVLKQLPFVPYEGAVHPEEDFVVWTNGNAFPETRTIEYRFTDPSGDVQSVYFDHDKEWSTVWMRQSLDAPRKEGNWLVELYDGDRKLLEKRFTVSRRAPLHWSFLDDKPGLRVMTVGTKPENEDFHALEVLNPRETAAVLVHGVPFESDRLLEYVWIAPDGTSDTYTFMHKAGWDTSWTYRNPNGEMAPGEWRVEVWLDGELLNHKEFRVSEDAPLFLPIGDPQSGAKYLQ